MTIYIDSINININAGSKAAEPHLGLAIISALAEASEKATPPTDENSAPSVGFTKYDAEGRELPPDATEWHHHWQHDTGIVWLNTNLAGKRHTASSAVEGVTALDGGWSIPTLEQLETEIDRTKYKPALRNPELFPGIDCDGWYWTSTPGASDPDYAWVVDLNGGYVGLYNRYHTAWVRPCRVRACASQ